MLVLKVVPVQRPQTHTFNNKVNWTSFSKTSLKRDCFISLFDHLKMKVFEILTYESSPGTPEMFCAKHTKF